MTLQRKCLKYFVSKPKAKKPPADNNSRITELDNLIQQLERVIKKHMNSSSPSFQILKPEDSKVSHTPSGSNSSTTSSGNRLQFVQSPAFNRAAQEPSPAKSRIDPVNGSQSAEGKKFGEEEQKNRKDDQERKEDQTPETKHSQKQNNLPEGMSEMDEILIKILSQPKDRSVVLQYENELNKFMKSSTRKLDFPPMSSYQRLILHKMASYYHLDHVSLQVDPVRIDLLLLLEQRPNSFIPHFQEQGKRNIILYKNPNSKIPTVTISYLLQQQPYVTEYIQNMNTTQYPQKNGLPETQTSQDTPAPQNQKILLKKRTEERQNKNNTKTNTKETATQDEAIQLEEREKQYNEARARIFGDENFKLHDLPEYDSPSQSKEKGHTQQAYNPEYDRSNVTFKTSTYHPYSKQPPSHYWYHTPTQPASAPFLHNYAHPMQSVPPQPAAMPNYNSYQPPLVFYPPHGSYPMMPQSSYLSYEFQPHHSAHAHPPNPSYQNQ